MWGRNPFENALPNAVECKESGGRTSVGCHLIPLDDASRRKHRRRQREGMSGESTA